MLSSYGCVWLCVCVCGFSYSSHHPKLFNSCYKQLLCVNSIQIHFILIIWIWIRKCWLCIHTRLGVRTNKKKFDYNGCCNNTFWSLGSTFFSVCKHVKKKFSSYPGILNFCSNTTTSNDLCDFYNSTPLTTMIITIIIVCRTKKKKKVWI